MLYLLDANVFIDANRDYYPIDRVPEFWEWLADMGSKGFVKIPIEIYEEIKEGKRKEKKEVDPLAIWSKNPENKNAILLDEEVDVSRVSYVTDEGYASDLSDVEIEKIGRDPFLIAYALKDNIERCVVTNEVSKPNKRRANRHIPDVCKSLNVMCYHTFEFLRELDFRTNWKTI